MKLHRKRMFFERTERTAIGKVTGLFVSLAMNGASLSAKRTQVSDELNDLSGRRLLFLRQLMR